MKEANRKIVVDAQQVERQQQQQKDGPKPDEFNVFNLDFSQQSPIAVRGYPAIDIDTSGASPYLLTNLDYLVGHTRGGADGAYRAWFLAKCPKDHSNQPKGRAQYPICAEHFRGGGQWHDDVCP